MLDSMITVSSGKLYVEVFYLYLRMFRCYWERSFYLHRKLCSSERWLKRSLFRHWERLQPQKHRLSSQVYSWISSFSLCDLWVFWIVLKFLWIFFWNNTWHSQVGANRQKLIARLCVSSEITSIEAVVSSATTENKSEDGSSSLILQFNKWRVYIFFTLLLDLECKSWNCLVFFFIANEYIHLPNEEFTQFLMCWKKRAKIV